MTRARRDLPITEKLLLTIPEVTALLGIGESKIRELVRDGELGVVRLGKLVRIKRTDLNAFVEQLQPDKDIAELPEWIQELATEGRRR